MKHIQKLSLALLLATPFLGHAEGVFNQKKGFNPVTEEMDDATGDFLKAMKQPAEVSQKAAKIELQQAAQPTAPTTAPKIKTVQQEEITITVVKHNTLPKKEADRRKIEAEIFEKREQLQEVEKSIERIKDQFPYENIRKEPTSQILEAESLIEGQKRIEKEFATIEKRSWYIRGGAATLSVLSAAAYGAAKAGVRVVEQTLERIPESETILMVCIPVAALLTIAAHNDLNKSQLPKNLAQIKILEIHATKERLTKLARDLEEQITKQNKLEAEIAELESKK